MITNKLPQKYRIKELWYGFRIEIYGYEETGFWFWKKKNWRWFPTNTMGGVLQVFPPQQRSITFKTLKDARRQIRDWEKPVKIHEP